MIKSMTGFGRCEISDESRKFSVEIKAVNHRYLDMNIKMPKKLSYFESSIRNLIKKYIQRGKVDIFITYEDDTENKIVIKYNKDVASEYFKHLQQIAEDFGLEEDLRVSNLSRYPEVFTMEDQSTKEKELWEILEKALKGATIQFVETRIKEGENLKKDLLGKLDEMIGYVDFIEERSPEILKEYRQKLEAKVQELLEDNTMIEESRIVTEVTIFADKICVDEETVRLRSHIDSTRKTLESGNGVGRKLDFIAQEMNREANTILAKANDLEISNVAIDLKAGIEKVREQIQNIE